MPWVHFLQHTGGMNYSSSDFVKRTDELEMLNGCNVDYKLGSITKDTGFVLVGAAALKQTRVHWDFIISDSQLLFKRC